MTSSTLPVTNFKYRGNYKLPPPKKNLNCEPMIYIIPIFRLQYSIESEVFC